MKYKMKSLRHNGVYILPYEPKSLSLQIQGRQITLGPETEQMAIAWIRKKQSVTPPDFLYSFNFFQDFLEKLKIENPPLSLLEQLDLTKFKNMEGILIENSFEELSKGVIDIDFSTIQIYLSKAVFEKNNMTKEEKKKLREERKTKREALKKKYGYAIVDGKTVEIANWTAEPSCIFAGRGNHPKRGKWKEGPKEEDIILNLSPDSPKPEGSWKDIVWEPQKMYIAKWKDKLFGKIKYIWFSDSAFLKQNREIEKFDKSKEFEKNYQKVRDYILQNLDSDDLKTRKIATVCYLIDAVCMRVGDEKDEDEANTVGATTLTRENITFLPNNIVKFDFLGKDSVRWEKEVKMPENVIINLKDFMKKSNETIFNGIKSDNVNAYLDEAMNGLTTKVFRTCSATKAVREYLQKNKISKDKSDFFKKHLAKLANLEAATVCNHKRTIPRSWSGSLERKKERLQKSKVKSKNNIIKYKKKIKDLKKTYKEKLSKYENNLKEQEKKLEEYKKEKKEKEKQNKSIKGLKKQISSKKKNIRNQKLRIRNLKKKHIERLEKVKLQFKNRKERDQENITKLEIQIEEQKETKDFNLNTSLKSYIDPRTYKNWAKKVDYDWKKYYPVSLQKKFSWMDKQ